MAASCALFLSSGYLIFVIYRCFVSAQCGRIICLSCLEFSWYTTCTLLIPFLALSIFALCGHNLYYSCNYLFIMPCVFPAFYMYIIDPVLHVGLVGLAVFGCQRAKLGPPYCTGFLLGPTGSTTRII